MRVREAVPEDGEAVRAVHYESILGLGRSSYSTEQAEAWAAGCATADYRATIESAERYCIVAQEDRGVVGFGTLALEAPDEYDPPVDGEVRAVYVHPAVARDGVGTALYEDLETTARKKGYRTLGLTASRNAVPFYEARGYERVRETDNEFSGHESTGVSGTVLQMRKELKE
ncbi:MAG: N-acetyltransferase family protein [Halopenitus sp.]